MDSRFEAVLWIGAGRAEHPSRLLNVAKKMLLVDCQQTIISELTRKFSDIDTVEVIDAVVADSAQSKTLFVTNLAEFSSTQPPLGLKEIFPGIRVIDEKPVKTIAINELLKRLQLLDTVNNYLFIDVPNQVKGILSALKAERTLNVFSRIDIQLSSIQYYEETVSIDEIEIFLFDNGFELINVNTEELDFPIRQFQKSKYWETLINSQDHVLKKCKDVERLNNEVTALNVSVEELEEINVDKEKNLADYKIWLINRKKEIGELRESLIQSELVVKTLKKNDVRIEKLFSGLDLKLSMQMMNIETLTINNETKLVAGINALGEHITDSMDEQYTKLQELKNIHRIFEQKSFLPLYGGFSIESDLALHMARCITDNHFDLLIEFGSGSSTVLIAKLLQIARGGIEAKKNKVTKHFVSFEQDDYYIKQTSHLLKQVGLEDFVDIYHTPLVIADEPGEYGKSKQMFYNCEEKIQKLGVNLRKKNSNILIFVDGPNNAAGDNASRELALFTVLDHFPKSNLHFVLDDYNRPSEKKIAQAWKDECLSRNLSFTESEWICRKGAFYLVVQSTNSDGTRKTSKG
jgi:hypothetical protein